MKLIRELLENKGDFVDRTTGSPVKTAVNGKIYSHIRVPLGQQMVILVGSPESVNGHGGLVGHLSDVVSTGLTDLSNLWIVDRDSATIKALEKKFESIKDNYTGTPHFVTSDLLVFLKQWKNSENGKIYFVDFDGTTGASKNYIDVYKQCLRLDVSYVAMVGSERRQSAEMKNLANELDYPDQYRRTHMKKADQLEKYGNVKNRQNSASPNRPAAASVLHDYLVIDSGQESVDLGLFGESGRTYVGTGKTPMFAFLFKVR